MASSSFPVFQEIEGEWTSVKTVEILGLRIPAYFTSDAQLLYDFITTFQTKSDDVFIVSYPKSGKRFNYNAALCNISFNLYSSNSNLVFFVCEQNDWSQGKQ